MHDRIRYHLDENVDPDVAKALRLYGVDVSTTQEAGLKGRTDEAQLSFARSEARVLVTHDTDFLHLRTQDHFGIAFCNRPDRTIGEVIRHLLLMYEVLSSEEIRGRVEFL